MSGRSSYLAGKAAELQVAGVYTDHGHRLLARRWRGPGGEIDLVMERDGEVVFIEVKSSKTFATAVQSLTQRQIRRLLASAEAALGFFGKGSLTPMRFDVALVDRAGRVEVIQNALQAA